MTAGNRLGAFAELLEAEWSNGNLSESAYERLNADLQGVDASYLREWLVTWRREGAQWQRRILQNESAVNVLVVELRTKDLHYRCDEAHGDCLGPLVAGPVIKWRECGEWTDTAREELRGRLNEQRGKVGLPLLGKHQ